MSFRDAVKENRKAVITLSDPELREIMPKLYELREKTARALHKFLKGEQASSEYNLHKHRALLAQLNDVIAIAEEELPSATMRELGKGATKATKVGAKKLETMVNQGEKKFSGAVGTLNIPVAKVLTNMKRTMMGRFQSKSDRYADAVGRRIRNELAVGVIKGETVGELTTRILGAGRAIALSKKGPTAIADAIADKNLFRSRSDAERLVRTELVNAYTESQLESLRVANEDDPGWLKMWDAANDKRVCRVCASLDNVVLPLNAVFMGGVQGPPIHPNDRYSLVPWRKSWGKPGKGL